MQIREWIASQSVLNPLASAGKNATKPNGSTDAFSQLFEGKKLNKPERNPIKTTVVHNPMLSDSEKIHKPVEKPVVKVDSSTQGSKKELGRKNQIESHEKLETKDVSNELDRAEVDAADQALKDKLVEMTGLSEEELNALMAMMGVSIDELNSMMEQLPAEFFELFEEIQVTMSTMEVNELLNEPIEPEMITKLSAQVEQLKQMVVEQEQSSQPLESSLFQNVVSNLSQIINKMNQLTESEPPAYSEISKVLSLVSESQEDSKKVDLGKSDTKDPEISIIKEGSLKSETSKSQDLQQSQGVDSKIEKTAVKTQPDESSENALYENADSEDALAFHQLVMRQPGLVSSQTVQATQVLKQDVFSQVMEAIKGSFKIDDNGTSMLVKLQPEQLGNVELKLNIHKGLVMAEIKVENEIVKAAIESNLDDLRQNLANKGFTVNQINVSVDTGKKQEQEELYEFQNRKKAAKNTVAGIDDDIESEEILRNYGYDENNLSTINYLG